MKCLYFDSNVMITFKIVCVGLSTLGQELSMANVERKTKVMSKLLEEILSSDNIALAIKQVKANKGKPGVDKMTVEEVEGYFKENGETIKSNPIIRGWINYFRIGSMKGAMKELDGYLRFRLRMCIWKQWKYPKTRVKRLRQCGFPEWECIAYGNTRKGYARCASTFLNHALPNKMFEEAGLVSLTEYYQLQYSF